MNEPLPDSPIFDLLPGASPPLVDAFNESSRCLGVDSEAFQALQDALDFCATDAPRGSTSSDAMASVEYLIVLYRTDLDALRFSNTLGRKIEQTSLALFNRIKPIMYISRRNGASDGEGTRLTDADCTDIREFLRYLVLLMKTAEAAMLRRMRDSDRLFDGLPSTVLGHVLNSFAEALFLTFLRRRFRQMFYFGEDILGELGIRRQVHEGDETHVDDAHEETIGRALSASCERRGSLLASVSALVEAFRVRFEEMELTGVDGRVYPRADLEQTFEWVSHHFREFNSAICVLNSRQRMAAWEQMPQTTQRLEVPSDARPVPMPKMRVTTILETEPWQDREQTQILMTHHRCLLTTCTIAYQEVRIRNRKTDAVGHWRSSVSVQYENGDPCLNSQSHIPLKRILHPEDPAVIEADFIARNCDIHRKLIDSLCTWLEFENDYVWLADRVPQLHYIRWIPYLGRRSRESEPNRIEHCCLLMSRAEAKVLELAGDARRLSRKEKRLFESAGITLPKNPVGVWHEHEYGGGSDDDGHDPPAEPSGQPTGRSSHLKPAPA